MNDLRNTAQYKRLLQYSIINDSKWFKSIVQNACRNSEKNSNRIYVYFCNMQDGIRAIKECERRNISHTDLLGPDYNGEYRLGIMMNWKENIPTRINRNKNIILD